jgi:GNAT superfamily N-acetyltransferase
VSAPSIRELTRDEVEPHIPTLIEDGFTPDIDVGVWLGAFADETLTGFVRVFDEGGSWMLEDVYVFPEFRRRGLATALIESARHDRDHLWLICDDPMIGYYENLGFAVAAKDDFPDPLAALYREKGEWPTASDHNHTAMRWSRARA